MTTRMRKCSLCSGTGVQLGTPGDTTPPCPACKGTGEKPLARLLTSRYSGDLVVELTTDSITIRPKGKRRGGPQEVTITAGALYDKLVWVGGFR